MNSDTQKTVHEQFEIRHGFTFDYPHVSSKMIVEQQSCPPYTIVISYPQNLNILVMGIFYSASTGLWGISISESMPGKLGPSPGWALFIGMMVISSNISGYLTGEWKSAGIRSLKYLAVSIGLIISALILIGYGNYKLY